jgi:hypothetical protein
VGKVGLRRRTESKPTFTFNHIICTDSLLNTYSPSMSYLALSTSSLQCKEKIGQGSNGPFIEWQVPMAEVRFFILMVFISLDE